MGKEERGRKGEYRRPQEMSRGGQEDPARFPKATIEEGRTAGNLLPTCTAEE
jgi:hypothetical protein